MPDEYGYYRVEFRWPKGKVIDVLGPFIPGTARRKVVGEQKVGGQLATTIQYANSPRQAEERFRKSSGKRQEFVRVIGRVQ